MICSRGIKIKKHIEGQLDNPMRYDELGRLPQLNAKMDLLTKALPIQH
jgi:hypothetical protein